MAAAGTLMILLSCQTPIAARAENPEEKIRYPVTGREECSRLMMELVSSVSDSKRHEFYVTGEDYEPETLVIARMFPETINISNTKLEEYMENGKKHVLCRIGFERQLDQKQGESPPDRENETIEGFWQEGDIQIRKIGKEWYRFRCIDDDYRNPYSEHQTYALFLCETVICSDIDSTDSQRKILTFGRTNNYKTSNIRTWLQENAGDWEKEAALAETGVNSAFVGKTKEGFCGEDADTELSGIGLPIQSVTDRLFLLSLEETIKYQEAVWEDSGAGSPCSRGFWLRTPAFDSDENGDFCHGEWEYAVDLENGCIIPSHIEDPKIGIRPAYCVTQGP